MPLIDLDAAIAAMQSESQSNNPYISGLAMRMADRLRALPTTVQPDPQVVVKPDRDTFDAMCAMRNAINEYIPMPSLESDLLQGPENSVFCAAVAEAVIARFLGITASQVRNRLLAGQTPREIALVALKKKEKKK